MSRNLLPTSLLVRLHVLIGFILFSGPGWCEISGVEHIDQPIQQHEFDLGKVQRGLQLHLGELLVISEKEFNLLDQIEQLDKNLRLQSIRLDIMVDRLNNQEELLVTKKRGLKEAESNKRRVRSHLEKRLRSYYLMGKTGVLNVTFSSKTLPDLMLLNDSYMTMFEYDKTLFDSYRVSIEQLTQARDAHEKESILLNEFIASAVEQQQELDTLLTDKRNLLEKIKTQKILHEQALKELKKAEDDLRVTLIRLKRNRSDTLKGFILNKGKMPPPVQGKLLTRFGESKDGDGLDIGISQGISIETLDGSAVKAIFDGQIIFAGYRKGFGNMVIIDHGLNYYTITTRIEKIIVEENQKVKGGDIIGTTGDIATLFEKGIYFEIRHDSKPLDPLKWISRQGLE